MSITLESLPPVVAEIAAPAATVYGILSLDVPNGMVRLMPEHVEGGRMAMIDVASPSKWHSVEVVITEPPSCITYRMIQGPCAKLERLFHVRERSGGQSRVLVESRWTPGGVFGRLSGHKVVTQATRALLSSIQQQAERTARVRLVDPLESAEMAIRGTYDHAARQYQLLVDVQQQELIEWDGTGHGIGTAQYAAFLSNALALPDTLCRSLQLAGALHDVGKSTIEAHLFRRDVALSAGGQRRLEQHPRLGAALVCQLPAGETLVPAIRHHHERWDGTGYPDGLSGTAIPLVARIIAVAEAADAMQRALPDRRARSPREVAGILERHAGRQWDPDLARQLATMLSESQATAPAGHY